MRNPPKSRTIYAMTLTLLFIFQLKLLAEEKRAPILAHYMPWYSTKSISSKWGWHWTMNDHFDPEKLTKNGQREIASHDYPLIGPYDSSDPHLLECHVLLMKLSGIDGVIVDWYGTEDFRGYGTIHRNTQLLLNFIKKADLKFSLCYEDRTIKEMVKAGQLKPNQDLSHAAEVFGWLEKNWFQEKAYFKLEGRPILTVFGPIYFKESRQWNEIFSGLSTRPIFYALPHLSSAAGAEASFGWVPVSGGKKATPSDWQKYLEKLYADQEKGRPNIAVAFPGYHDIYAEANLHDSYGHIADRDGETFNETLDLALKSQSPLIQIATWNDFGEGTVIEPTKRFGYRYLETLQKKTQSSHQFTPEDLRLPVKLYQLRKKPETNTASMKKLAAASELLFSSKCAEARLILNNLSKTSDTPTQTDHLQKPKTPSPAR